MTDGAAAEVSGRAEALVVASVGAARARGRGVAARRRVRARRRRRRARAEVPARRRRLRKVMSVGEVWRGKVEEALFSCQRLNRIFLLQCM